MHNMYAYKVQKVKMSKNYDKTHFYLTRYIPYLQRVEKVTLGYDELELDQKKSAEITLDAFHYSKFSLKS